MSSPTEVFKEIVASRRSLRAFQSQPVPEDILQSVFTTAMQAPSNCNTQPWLVHVVSGELLETLRSEMAAGFTAGELSMDFPYDGSYDGVYKERQYGSAQALYDSIGIQRQDKVKRQAQFMRNFSFFDAPHVAFLCLPEPFGLREACDMGMFAQNLMLSLTAHGLGSCPQTALSFQVDYVKQKLDIDPSEKLVFGLSFGYPEVDAPVNQCQTDRAALEDIVTFHQ
jgi:nitroreductase